MKPRSRIHIVQSGENLSRIARQYGMTWRELYELPENQRFRELRQQPDRIQPGDCVFVPALNEAARRLGAFCGDVS